jgi:predicted DNA-binding protein with PD1-like motif
MQFTEAKMGRVFVLRLQDGDRLPETLETFAAENHVLSALCFLLGGAKQDSRVVVGPRNGGILPVEPVVALLGGVHEVCGVGTIFVNEEGLPKLHMHASFGRGEKSVTGCVRLGVEVWRIGEVVVLELAGTNACRVVDDETGFELLKIS